MPLPTQLDTLVNSTRRQPSPTPSSEDEELPWPSSPVRPPKKDINAMPPDSSPSTPQQTQSSAESLLSTRDHSEREETPEDVVTDKRVTRAANGISKKAPVDPNNVVKH